VRLSPFADLNDLPVYPEELETHRHIISALTDMDILYVHLSDQSQGRYPFIPLDYIKEVRKRFSNLLMLAGGYTADFAEATLNEGLADMIAFGRPFIANPDLVGRFRNDLPLAVADINKFYEGGQTGYTDYPASAELHSHLCEILG
jgi:N-ethylmaleimide reductase